LENYIGYQFQVFVFEIVQRQHYYLFSRGARKPNNNGQGKPNGSDGGGDDDKDMSQYPKVESVQETESRLDDIDKSIARMEESSDSEEEECEATEQLQVEESYKSNSDLKKATKNAHKSKRAVKNLEDVKQKLSEGAEPHGTSILYYCWYTIIVAEFESQVRYLVVD
jgi:hypothetical protein